MQSYRQSLVNNLGTKVEQLQTKGHRAPTKLHRRAAFLRSHGKIKSMRIHR